MKKILPFFVLMIISISACESNNQSAEQKRKDTTIVMKVPAKDTVEKDTSLGPDIAALSPAKDTLQVNLEMRAGEHITIPVDVLSGDSIFGQLRSDDKSANIRFTQIALPDQTFDGPFDRELSYRVKKAGRYALIIGQNMMAGDPWNGKFTLKVWVK